jgi:amino acid transporter
MLSLLLAGSIYAYPAQGLHSYVGFLVGWGYALITVLTVLSGYFGVKFGTRVGVVLGGLELLIFIALSIWMFTHATASASPVLNTFTLKYATVKGSPGRPGCSAGRSTWSCPSSARWSCCPCWPRQWASEGRG